MLRSSGRIRGNDEAIHQVEQGVRHLPDLWMSRHHDQQRQSDARAYLLGVAVPHEIHPSRTVQRKDLADMTHDELEQQLAEVTAQLADLTAQLATVTQERDEAMNHAAGMSNNVTHLGQQVARMQEQRDHEAMMHAACLSIAEGYPGWDVPFAVDSLATASVRSLRQQVAALELENADLLTNLSLCKGNELAQQIVTLTAERDEHRRWREKLADDLHEREQQLAAMTQERDLLHRDNHALRAEVEDWRQKFQKALTP